MEAVEEEADDSGPSLPGSPEIRAAAEQKWAEVIHAGEWPTLASAIQAAQTWAEGVPLTSRSEEKTVPPWRRSKPESTPREKARPYKRAQSAATPGSSLKRSYPQICASSFLLGMVVSPATEQPVPLLDADETTCAECQTSKTAVWRTSRQDVAIILCSPCYMKGQWRGVGMESPGPSSSSGPLSATTLIYSLSASNDLYIVDSP